MSRPATSRARHSRLDVAWRQHVGDRADQQDAARVSVLVRVGPAEPERHLLMVADGMGGMAEGALAARTAVRTLPEHVRAAWSAEHTRVEQLSGAFHETHEDVKRALAGANGGCALTACYVRGGPGGIACFAHMGDVLGLLLRRDRPGHYRVAHRTEPHRFGRHVLSRCVGSRLSDRDQAEVSRDLLLNPGDVIVLASDGVGDSVDEATVLALAAGNPKARALAEALLRVALGAATTGRDNATVMVARVSAMFLSPPERDWELGE